jgi:hypothetical protein
MAGRVEKTISYNKKMFTRTIQVITLKGFLIKRTLFVLQLNKSIN